MIHPRSLVGVEGRSESMSNASTTSGGAECPSSDLRHWFHAYFFTAIPLVAVVTALMWPILRVQYALGEASDFGPHIEVVERFVAGTNRTLTHPVFHWLVGAVAYVASPGDYRTAGLYCGMLLYQFQALVLLGYLTRPSAFPCGGVRRTDWIISSAGVLALLLCNPISSFTWFEFDIHPHTIYRGYLTANVFHNPTMLALKPFALLTFWSAMHSLETAERGMRRLRQFAWLGLVCAISSLAKPNFVLCFVPALTGWVLFQTLRLPDRRTLLRYWFTLGVVTCASVAALGLQYMQYAQYEAANSSSIAFAPLRLVKDSWDMQVLKLAASLAFPAAVVVLFLRKAAADTRLWVSWMMLVVGSVTAVSFVEQGPQMWARNFSWGPHIAMFIVFVESFAFLRSVGRETTPLTPARESYLRRSGYCFALLACHVTSGLGIYMLFRNAGQAS